MHLEYEIKFTNIEKEIIVQKLLKTWFSCKKKEFISKRVTFHPQKTEKNEWFRVRSEESHTTLTYKCIHNNSISWLEEIETSVSNFETTILLLEKTGLIKTAFQENKREIWVRNNVEICIDTWPWLKPYIEIEGEDESAVKKIVIELWLDWENGLFWGSEVVYEKELNIPKNIFIKMPLISFENPPKIWNSEI